LLLAVIAPVPARAQDPPAEQLARAREHFSRGVTAAKEDRWEDALDAFSTAYSLSEQPSILFNLAGAQIKTGRWVPSARWMAGWCGQVAWRTW
jgi:hypothetical protein